MQDKELALEYPSVPCPLLREGLAVKKKKRKEKNKEKKPTKLDHRLNEQECYVSPSMTRQDDSNDSLILLTR